MHGFWGKETQGHPGLKYWVCLRVKILPKPSLEERGVIHPFKMKLKRSREDEVVAKLKRQHNGPFLVCFFLQAASKCTGTETS